MAGTLTHAYFSLDLYDKLSIKSKELLISEKENLKIFSQSNDVLYFYNILSLKKGKKFRDFGLYTHKHKSYEFFETLINYIKSNNLMFNSKVMAYLYGMLSHYILDSTIHPYIIYKTGVFDKNNKDTYKYNMLHCDLENYIDNYIVSIKENIKPKKFKCYRFCFNVDFDNDLIKTINYTYKEVYKIDNFSNYYLKAIKQTKSFYKKFRYDPTCIKKSIYKLIDRISSKKRLRKSPLSYNIKIKKEYLNLEHNTWYNPVDKRSKNSESVLELYINALNKTTSIISELNKYFYYDKDINLKKVIGNYSYVHGKDCSKKKELKYFEF